MSYVNSAIHGNDSKTAKTSCSTFSKENQKDLHIQFFTNLCKSLGSYQENQHFICKTPKISLMKDVMNKLDMKMNLQTLWRDADKDLMSIYISQF